jgi:uncharacterized membrane protein YphA (DoxX/SURF4 family)
MIDSAQEESFMNIAPKIARYLLGLMFFVFGGAGLLNLFPPPPDLPVALQNFTSAIVATGYFFPFLKATETICGLLLILGLAPAVMLVILAPITIQIILLHGFLTPGLKNLVLPMVILALHLVAAKGYWHLYRPLFGRKN